MWRVVERGLRLRVFLSLVSRGPGGPALDYSALHLEPESLWSNHECVPSRTGRRHERDEGCL
jgi:hypothetical protein